MSAIAGILDIRYNEDIIHAMMATMRVRGPNAAGSYLTNQTCLLHTSLSSDEQNMVLDYNNERYIITYDGTIYNKEELKAELSACGHIFDGFSDSELILHGYAQWKEKILNKCNGVFAFAVLEEHSGRVFLARDRIGVKPFFYTMHRGGMIFASEIKTILAYPDVPAEIDEEGIAQLLLLGPGRKPGSGVFYNINELEPGHYGIYEDGKLHITRYWKLTDRIYTESFEKTAEQVRDLVLDAVRRQMVSDVPIGTFLSGGLDSSLVSAICARELDAQGKVLDTFSLDYEDNDIHFKPGKFQPNADPEYIRIMQTHLDSHHHWTLLTAQELADNLEASVLARDLPGMADVDSSLLAFCGQISPHVKVAISGECADEIFGGYPWFRDPTVREQDGFPWAQNINQRAQLLHPVLREKMDATDFVYSCYHDSLVQCDILPENTATEARMKQMVNLNFRWFMQTLLDRNDRMSMAKGLEVRVPYCDYRIAEYMYAVPWEFKDHRGYEKGLLRYAMRGVLPDAVLFRKKSPYPKTYDPRYLQMVVKQFREMLDDSCAPIFDIVDKTALQALPEQEFAWPWYGQLMQLPQTLAYMLQLNFWMKHYCVRIC
jgi:asparagine synthase (glutamine-hydrolysing)